MSVGNDPKMRGASRGAKQIRSDLGNPGTSLGSESIPEDQQIFKTLNDLTPASIQYTTKPTGCEDIRAAQHQNYVANQYGGYRTNTMDDIDRSQNPDITILEGQGMNQGEPFVPPTAAGTSTMMGKSPQRPHGASAGDKTPIGNRF